MIDSGSKGYPEQVSAGCHFVNLVRNFLRAKTKWPSDLSRIFQQMKPGTSVIPHFYVILTGQSISCIIFKIQGHLQGQISKNTILTNKARNMCNTSFSRDFVWKIHLWYYFGDPRSSSRSKSHFQSRKQNGRQIFQGQIWFFDKWR